MKIKMMRICLVLAVSALAISCEPAPEESPETVESAVVANDDGAQVSKPAAASEFVAKEPAESGCPHAKAGNHDRVAGECPYRGAVEGGCDGNCEKCPFAKQGGCNGNCADCPHKEAAAHGTCAAMPGGCPHAAREGGCGAHDDLDDVPGAV